MPVTWVWVLLPNEQHALGEVFFFSITKYPKNTSQALHNITDIICDPRHISEFTYHGLLINQTKKITIQPTSSFQRIW